MIVFLFYLFLLGVFFWVWRIFFVGLVIGLLFIEMFSFVVICFNVWEVGIIDFIVDFMKWLFIVFSIWLSFSIILVVNIFLLVW